MESVATNKRYPDELKERAVAMVLEWRRERGRTDGGLTDVATMLGVHPESIRGWLKRYQTDAGVRPGLTTDERKRLKDLELKRANEMAVRRASAYFAHAELDRPWR
jgi:transposase